MESIECKCKVEIHKKKNDVFFFLGIHVTLPSGENKYFCDMLTEKMVLEYSEKHKIPINHE